MALQGTGSLCHILLVQGVLGLLGEVVTSVLGEGPQVPLRMGAFGSCVWHVQLAAPLCDRGVYSKSLFEPRVP